MARTFVAGCAVSLGCTNRVGADETISSAVTSADLSELLNPFRERAGVPALAAGVMMNGRMIALGAVGVRKAGSSPTVGRLDKFHLGSCTKPFTTTLAARLVEQGKIKWQSTLPGIFPERAARFDIGFKNVTLELLLRHRAGISEKAGNWGPAGRPLNERRLINLDAVLTQSPAYEPDTRFEYSNAGYVIAATMLERATGLLWEELMQKHVCRPLGMSSAGYGSPATPAKTDQPWAHKSVDGHFEPDYAEPNPPPRAPAGNMHCSIHDMLRLADIYATNGKNVPQFLSSGSFQKLNSRSDVDTRAFPDAQGHTIAWFVTKRQWAKGHLFMHLGSNLRNFCAIWIDPSSALSIAVATNAAGGGKVAPMVDNLVQQLGRDFSK